MLDILKSELLNLSQIYDEMKSDMPKPSVYKERELSLRKECQNFFTKLYKAYQEKLITDAEVLELLTFKLPKHESTIGGINVGEILFQRDKIDSNDAQIFKMFIELLQQVTDKHPIGVLKLLERYYFTGNSWNDNMAPFFSYLYHYDKSDESDIAIARIIEIILIKKPVNCDDRIIDIINSLLPMQKYPFVETLLINTSEKEVIQEFICKLIIHRTRHWDASNILSFLRKCLQHSADVVQGIIDYQDGKLAKLLNDKGELALIKSEALQQQAEPEKLDALKWKANTNSVSTLHTSPATMFGSVSPINSVEPEMSSEEETSSEEVFEQLENEFPLKSISKFSPH